MNKILQDHRIRCCVIYLDDVVVFGRTWEDCWESTLSVLRELTDNGLAISAAKVRFLASDIMMLGHRVVNGQTFPNPKRLEKLANFLVPKTFKALQSLFGLLNYFRDYIPGFAAAVLPV